MLHFTGLTVKALIDSVIQVIKVWEIEKNHFANCFSIALNAINAYAYLKSYEKSWFNLDNLSSSYQSLKSFYLRAFQPKINTPRSQLGVIFPPKISKKSKFLYQDESTTIPILDLLPEEPTEKPERDLHASIMDKEEELQQNITRTQSAHSEDILTEAQQNILNELAEVVVTKTKTQTTPPKVRKENYCKRNDAASIEIFVEVTDSNEENKSQASKTSEKKPTTTEDETSDVSETPQKQRKPYTTMSSLRDHASEKLVALFDLSSPVQNEIAKKSDIFLAKRKSIFEVLKPPKKEAGQVPISRISSESISIDVVHNRYQLKLAETQLSDNIAKFEQYKTYYINAGLQNAPAMLPSPMMQPMMYPPPPQVYYPPPPPQQCTGYVPGCKRKHHHHHQQPAYQQMNPWVS